MIMGNYNKESTEKYQNSLTERQVDGVLLFNSKIPSAYLSEEYVDLVYSSVVVKQKQLIRKLVR